MLDYFAQEVADGRDIVPNLQKAVNAVMASALASGKLPKKKVGRPTDLRELDLQRRIATQIRQLRSQGIAMSKAVLDVSERECCDERTVYKCFKRHKGWVDREAQKDGMLAAYWAGAAPVLQAVVATMTATDRRLAMENMLEDRRKYRDDLPMFRSARKLIGSD